MKNQNTKNHILKPSKFVFVILHYQALDETIHETQHILNGLDGNNQVVIVDNASPNKSGVKLKAIFAENQNVDVILNQENLGYANGNNLGIAFAIKKYNPDFLVVANNDIEFLQSNFNQLVEQSYNEQTFDLLGPDIFVPETEIHQNPKKQTGYSVAEVEKIHRYSKKLLNQNKLMFWIRANLKRIRGLRRFVLNIRQSKKSRHTVMKKNVVLHGSLLVFSKSFFHQLNAPFDEGTFFYFETEILDRKMRDLKLVSKYDPSIVVKHHQNTSTKQSFKSAVAQQKFQLENMKKSTQRFIDLFG